MTPEQGETIEVIKIRIDELKKRSARAGLVAGLTGCKEAKLEAEYTSSRITALMAVGSDLLKAVKDAS